MKFKIKEKQIKALDKGETTVRDLFPEVFKESMVGKWVKPEKEEGSIWFIESINDSGKGEGYGLLSGDWTVSNNILINRDTFIWRPATTEEVTEALTKEAIKRGFVDGARYNSLPHILYNSENNTKVDICRYDNNLNVLFSRLGIMFHNGKWAEVIPQVKAMTVAEISKELGYEIRIIE